MRDYISHNPRPPGDLQTSTNPIRGMMNYISQARTELQTLTNQYFCFMMNYISHNPPWEAGELLTFRTPIGGYDELHLPQATRKKNYNLHQESVLTSLLITTRTILTSPFDEGNSTASWNILVIHHLYTFIYIVLYIFFFYTPKLFS